ncbi:helix-turn-helix transcriptional regulator [Streptomyces sp. HK10]|uniref:helix-turn-helix transcriptional regulator n=1 Tax=Streptomyces sp. HK10 TaxID=3373255 RepID=UPI003748A9F8
MASQRRPLASIEEVAEYLGVTVATIYTWRYKGTGPRFSKVGRHLKARWSDVDAWLDEQATDRKAAA